MAGLRDASSTHFEADTRGLWVKVPLADFLKSQERKKPVTTIDIQHAPELIAHFSALFKKGAAIKKFSCCELKGEEGADLLNNLRSCSLLKSLALRSISLEMASPLIALLKNTFASSLKITHAFNNTLSMIEPGLMYGSPIRTLAVSYQDPRYQPAQRSPRAAMTPPTIPPLTLTPAQKSPRHASADVESNALANILQSIYAIKLSHGKFRADSFSPIAIALKTTSSLTKLTLTHFNIDSRAAVLIGGSLKENRSITHLDLSSTPIKECGQIAFAHSLVWNDTLRYLNITGLALTQKSYDEFTTTFQYNYRLTEFKFIFYTPRYEKKPDHVYTLIERNAENIIKRNAKLAHLLLEQLQ